jgi:hypothetical protein
MAEGDRQPAVAGALAAGLVSVGAALRLAVAGPGLAAAPAVFAAEGAVLDPEYALYRNTSLRR